MPAAYPINSFQPIVPFDGAPTDQSIGMLGQMGVDVSSGAYYQKIGGKWYPYGEGPLAQVLTTLTGNASIDGSMADGASMNNATFVAQDQNGQPMEASLAITLSSSTAVTSTQSITTNASNGSATVSVTDTVAESVTVTAKSGSKSATATLNFVAVPEAVVAT